jgi:hypothetical protein
MDKPIADVTFTAMNGVALTILRNPRGLWSADIGSLTIGPMAWSALVTNVEMNLNPTNIRRTLAKAAA